MLDDELAEFLEGDCSLVVGLVLDDGTPLASQAWALTVLQRDPPLVSVVLAERDTAGISEPVGARLALTGADVPTLSSRQVKGRVLAHEAATEADLAAVEQHCEAFFLAVHHADGEPVELLRRMVPPSFRAWTVQLDELYDQTPGPGAGAALHGAES